MSSQPAVRPPPALYIRHERPDNPFNDAFAVENMQDIPTTSGEAVRGRIVTDVSPSPMNRSHFSPDTPRPDLEKGHGEFSLHPSLSLGRRIKRSIRSSRGSLLQNDKFDSESRQQQKESPRLNWILGGLLVVLLLLLIGNVVYLDIRMISLNSSTPQRPISNTPLGATQKDSATPNSSSSPSGSASPSPTDGVFSTNQQGLSNRVLNCISKFPSEAVTNAPAFCNECMPPLSTVPANAFPPGTLQEDTLTKAKIFCQNTVF